MINEQVSAQHPAPLPNEHPSTTYTDALNREWQYWPTSAAEQMWHESVCNQSGCDHPAAFVGLTDVLRNGTLHYDSAAAWCYWCFPHTAMTADAERMAKHAEWARRATVQECIELIRRTRDEAGDTDTVDAVLTRLIGELGHVAVDRESTRAYSIVPEENWGGRAPTPGQAYAVRPLGNRDAVPDDVVAMELKYSQPNN